MKPDRLIFCNLGHDGGYLYKFPSDFPMSHDLGLILFTHVGRMLGSYFQHRRQICSSGNVKVQEAFTCLNKFARAFYSWLSRASDPKIFHMLSAIAGPSSRACRSHINQVISRMQNLAGLQFGSLREEHALQLFLARLANTTLGRLWNDFEQQHACNLLTLAGAAAIVPPLENISPKMLAESMALGNIDGYINRPLDQPYLEGKHLSCACVAVPSTIFQEDAIEPKTGIKFPAFLEEDPSPATTVLVGMGFKGMKIMKVKNLNLYAFGLYMQPNSICEKLGPKYASVPTTTLKDHPDFYNDLLRENLHMRVRLVVNYNGLSIGAVRDVFEKSLGLRLQKMNPNTDYRCLKTFYAHTGCSTVAWVSFCVVYCFCGTVEDAGDLGGLQPSDALPTNSERFAANTVQLSDITPAKDGKLVLIELIDAKTKEHKETLEVPGSVIWRWIRPFVPEDAAVATHRLI